MKGTGIIRRVDDLGRILIPKEIRRQLKIREGDPLEIFTDNEAVILKKYSLVKEFRKSAAKYAKILAQESGHTVIICNKDIIVAVGRSTLLKDSSDIEKICAVGKPISAPLQDAIGQHKSFITTRGNLDFIGVTDYSDEKCVRHQAVMPLIYEGEAEGALILLSMRQECPISEEDQKMMRIVASCIIDDD